MKAVFCCAALAGACGGTDPAGGPDVNGDAGAPTDGSTNNNTGAFPARWQVSTVDDGNTGFIPSIARAPDGTMGIAYLRRSADAGVCMKMGAMGEPVARWELMYASSRGGADFATEQVTAFNLVVITAVSLAFDSMNRPVIVFTGGNETLNVCGGTDAMMATKNGPAWDIRTLDADGTATPIFPEDVTACAQFQNTCNAAGADGVVGAWPALGFAGGQPVVVFRDTHYGWAQDDEEKSDLEVWWNGQMGTLDATWGGGVFTNLTVDGSGNVYAAHANKRQNSHGAGIWVFRNAGGTWARQKVSNELEVGSKLGMASTGARVAIAYHAEGDKKLRYLETADGMAWGAEEVVDQSGNTGRVPSLAFTSGGVAAVSYHSCGPFNPNSDDCPQNVDALRYAMKENGRWRAVTVVEERAGVDGSYTALAFDADGQPVIAYQAQFFDPIDNTVLRQLRVARGRPQ